MYSVTYVIWALASKDYTQFIEKGSLKFIIITLLKVIGSYFSKISLGMGLGKLEASSHHTWLFIGKKISSQYTILLIAYIDRDLNLNCV